MSKQVNFRAPDVLADVMLKAAEKAGRTLTAEILATLEERYLGPSEDVPASMSRTSTPKAPREAVPVVRASDLAKVEAGGASMKLAMDRAGVAQWDPSAKRPQYQKGASAKGKSGR